MHIDFVRGKRLIKGHLWHNGLWFNPTYVITACSHASSDTPGRLNQNVNDYRGYLMSGVVFIIVGVSAEYSVPVHI